MGLQIYLLETIVSCYCFQNNFELVLKILSLLDADYSYDIHMKICCLTSLALFYIIIMLVFEIPL